MYVDLETGTILNGPIVQIPMDVEFPTEDMSDSEWIEFATEHGVKIG